MQFERQAHHGGHRRKGDPALAESQLETQHFLAFKLAFADDPHIRNGAGIGARFRPGQAKAGDFGPVGQPGEPALFLFVGAVFHQQLTGAQRVGHHGGHGGGAGAAGDLAHDPALGVGPKVSTTKLLGDDQAQEALVFQELPGLFGQILPMMVDVELIEHGAELFHFIIEEALLFLGQLGQTDLREFVPVGPAAEQVFFPPGGARLQRFTLGGAHARHGFAQHLEHRLGQHGAAQSRNVENQENRRQWYHQPQRPEGRSQIPQQIPGQGHRSGAQRQRNAPVDDHTDNHQQHYNGQQNHNLLPYSPTSGSNSGPHSPNNSVICDPLGDNFVPGRAGLLAGVQPRRQGAPISGQRRHQPHHQGQPQYAQH